MQKRVFYILCLVLSFVFLSSKILLACEFCTVAFMGKKEKVSDEGKLSKVQAKVFYEDQDWDEISAAQAHQLHHQGHHTHDKQDEQIVHTMFGFNVNDRLSFDLDIPYVTRHFIEIDSHSHLGENQTSQGLGDITVTGDYRFIEDKEKSLGVILGVKTPTGETDNHTSFGDLIEPELQPGTGSLDYLAGLSGSFHPGKMYFSASAIYVYKTEGEQEFRFGDVFSVSFFAGRNFEINDQLKIKAGVMMNNQLEKKQNDDGGAIKDSGGYTMLVGPQMAFNWSSISAEFSYLSPAVQELGGVHQELKGIWAGALSVKF